MSSTGIVFAAAVALGVSACWTLLPLPRGVALACAAVAVMIAIGNRRAWFLVPLALGLLRGGAAIEEREARRLTGARRVEGVLEVLAPEGSGVRISGGGLTLLLGDPPPSVPDPGWTFRGLVRADPVRSRAEPSAFRADRWAAQRGLDGRARVLGEVTDARPAPGAPAALRRAAHRFRERTAARLGGGDAAELLVALLLGDRRGLDAEERERFRRAGLAHVLALSGLHAGILALGVGALLRSARVRGPALAATVVAFLGTFAFVTGARPPILRACGTGALAVVGLAAGRRSRAGHSLGLIGGAMVLAHPLVLQDAGFRLSFTAAGILAIAAARPRVPRRAGKIARLGEAVAISAAVTLGTLPEIAASFGRVSLLSPGTNLLAGPPAGAALAWGALAAALPVPEALADRLAAAARLAATALLLLAQAGARLPGGDVRLPALGLGGTLLTLGIAGLWAAGRRPCGRARAALLALGVLFAAGRIPRDRLTFLDVGQGNAILVEGGGRAVLVDGGAPDPAGGSRASPAVSHRRLRALDAVVATHGDADHAGGLEEIVRSARGVVLVEPTRRGPPPEAIGRMETVVRSRRDGVVRPGAEGVRLAGGRLVVASAWPEAIPPEGADENAHSLVAHWRAGPAAAWLTGDLGWEGEKELARSRSPRVLRAPILLAGHHGSRGSTGEELLAAVHPSLVVVSCGAGNVYGHPHAETLARVRAAGAALLRTDRDGTVTVTATPRGFRLRWERGFPGPRALLPAFPLPRGERFP